MAHPNFLLSLFEQSITLHEGLGREIGNEFGKILGLEIDPYNALTSFEEGHVSSIYNDPPNKNPRDRAKLVSINHLNRRR